MDFSWNLEVKLVELGVTGLGVRSGGVLPAGDRGDRTGEDQGRPDGDDEDCVWTRLCEGCGIPSVKCQVCGRTKELSVEEKTVSVQYQGK